MISTYAFAMPDQDEDVDFEVHLETFRADDRKRHDVIQVVANTCGWRY